MKYLLLFIALVIALPAVSAPVENNTLAAQHRDLFTSRANLKVQFEQSVYRKLRNKTYKREGTAFFSKPGLFYWEFNDKAGAEKWFYDGERLSHLQTGSNSVTHFSSKNSFHRELQDIVDLVLDSNKLFQNYDPKLISSEKKNYEFQLVPKRKNSDFNEIMVKISAERKYIKSIVVNYKDGNSTGFLFKNPRSPANIDIKLYRFDKAKYPGVKEKQL